MVFIGTTIKTAPIVVLFATKSFSLHPQNLTLEVVGRHFMTSSNMEQ